MNQYKTSTKPVQKPVQKKLAKVSESVVSSRVKEKGLVINVPMSHNVSFEKIRFTVFKNPGKLEQ